jgi:pantothenate synthetase
VDSGTAREVGTMANGPLRVFLSHTSDLGKPDEVGSFVAAAAAAVLRARHAVTDMAYFAARDTAPAAVCVDMVAQSDVYVGIIGLCTVRD